MRKLILELQISLDGYIADKDGTTKAWLWNWSDDWNWDPSLRQYHVDLTESADCILLSRQMVKDGFIKHWEEMANKNDNPQSGFARHIKHARKVVFSRTLKAVEGENVVLTRGELADEVNALKKSAGKNILVYGGAKFVSSLIEADLIDEFHFLVNPCALGSGLPIFEKIASSPLNLSLTSATSYPCGVVLSKYTRRLPGKL